MNSDLTKRVEALEKRLKLLEEEQAILSTLYTYAHTIDYGLKAQWLDCFAEDAVYRVQAFGVTLPDLFGIAQPTTGLKGRAALSAYIAKHTNAPEMWHKHCLVEPIIKLEGDNKASVESYFARLDEDQNGAYVLAFGRYHDQMVKSPDGKWRFKERICEIESRPAKR
jgi:3-phenylpropionate/cinnamic acid dioxygenase small subunit